MSRLLVIPQLAKGQSRLSADADVRMPGLTGAGWSSAKFLEDIDNGTYLDFVIRPGFRVRSDEVHSFC